MAIREAGALLWSTLSEIARRKEVRPVVRVFTKLHVSLYRRSGGKAQAPGYPTLLLTTLGRKTGKPRTIPLVYVTEGDRFVIAAAYSGSDQNPAWWLNLQHNKNAVVQVMRKKVSVRAELALPHEREALWKRLIAMYPPFAEYQTRTKREIPVIVLWPV
jgi:F420H(2)-dependent quinone reductase